MSRAGALPQYNPNPNVPVGFPSNNQQTFKKSLDNNFQQMQPHQQMQPPIQQQPQSRLQKNKRHILFYQPGCQDSGEFLKMLDFSKTLKQMFIHVNILTPNQKVPDAVQFTPTIFTLPNYSMYGPDDAFKWLQKEIIKEQQTGQQQIGQQQIGQQQTGQQLNNPMGGGIGARVNAPVYNPGGAGGGNPPPNMRSTPAGKEPSQNFNTYDPNRDGGIRPFMSDMDSGKGGGFSYIGTDQPPPMNYEHLPRQNTQQSQQNQTPQFLNPQQGRPKKLEDSVYNNFLAQRNADPYIQQSMPNSF